MAIFMGIAYFLQGLVVFSRYILVIFAFLTCFVKFDFYFWVSKAILLELYGDHILNMPICLILFAYHTFDISVTSLYCMHYCRVGHLSSLNDGFQLPF